MRRAASKTGRGIFMRRTTVLALGYASWLERLVDTITANELGGDR
jgi:hypothetical protein